MVLGVDVGAVRVAQRIALVEVAAPCVRHSLAVLRAVLVLEDGHVRPAKVEGACFARGLFRHDLACHGRWSHGDLCAPELCWLCRLLVCHGGREPVQRCGGIVAGTEGGGKRAKLVRSANGSSAHFTRGQDQGTAQLDVAWAIVCCSFVYVVNMRSRARRNVRIERFAAKSCRGLGRQRG